MEKYGVDTETEAAKTAQAAPVKDVPRCPQCDAPLIKATNVPSCPKCGTEPFEPK